MRTKTAQWRRQRSCRLERQAHERLSLQEFARRQRFAPRELQPCHPHGAAAARNVDAILRCAEYRTRRSLRSFAVALRLEQLSLPNSQLLPPEAGFSDRPGIECTNLTPNAARILA